MLRLFGMALMVGVGIAMGGMMLGAIVALLLTAIREMVRMRAVKKRKGLK